MSKIVLATHIKSQKQQVARATLHYKCCNCESAEFGAVVFAIVRPVCLSDCLLRAENTRRVNIILRNCTTHTSNDAQWHQLKVTLKTSIIFIKACRESGEKLTNLSRFGRFLSCTSKLTLFDIDRRLKIATSFHVLLNLYITWSWY